MRTHGLAFGGDYVVPTNLNLFLRLGHATTRLFKPLSHQGCVFTGTGPCGVLEHINIPVVSHLDAVGVSIERRGVSIGRCGVC